MHYSKIQSVYRRDEKTHKFIIGEWSTPEILYLNNNIWTWTEKVNGTNCKVMWDGTNVSFGGKSDNAQMPIFLIETLQKLFTAEKIKNTFSNLEPGVDIVFYGEGYGPKIQSGGNYRNDLSFILFDVLVGPWWLERDNVEDIGAKLGIDVVPIIGEGSLSSAIDLVKSGFKSKVAIKDYQAEGLVMRPKVELFSRKERIITKVKTKDFTK